MSNIFIGNGWRSGEKIYLNVQLLGSVSDEFLEMGRKVVRHLHVSEQFIIKACTPKWVRRQPCDQQIWLYTACKL